MSKDHGNHIPSENLDLAGHFDIGFDIVKLKIKKSWLLYITYRKTRGLKMSFYASFWGRILFSSKRCIVKY